MKGLAGGFFSFSILASAALLGGCATGAQNLGLGISALTGVGGSVPGSGVEVIYYLGVFDPQDQLPPTVYRIRLRGQASVLSSTQFASGWVRAELVDSLSSGGRFIDGSVKVDDTNSLAGSALATGRRLVMFGPEGFREAPKDHRLVVVMGSDPSAYFEAIDSALGAVSDTWVENQNSKLINQLFVEIAQLQGQTGRLADLQRHVDAAFDADAGE